MVGTKSTCWRNGHATSCVITLLLVAMAGLPSALGTEDLSNGLAQSTGAKAEGAGLEVSEIDSMELTGTNPTHLQVWVNATNPGSEPAVNLTAQMRGAETAIVLGDWTTYAHQATVSRGGSNTETFEVIPRTILTVGVQITSNSPLGSVGLLVTSPDGQEYPGSSGGNGAGVTVPQSDVDAGVFGEWAATVTHTGGVRAISYNFATSVHYTDVFDNLTLAELPPGETYQFYYNIWAEEPDTTIPPGMTITVNGTVVEAGAETRVSYIARVGSPVEELPVGPTTVAGGGDFGAAAVAVVVVIAIGAIGAYAWFRRGWRPAQLLSVMRRPKGTEAPAAPPKQE